MKKDVSFVILSFNDSDMAIKAVQSILRLKTRYSYDIFVVDNGSHDGTPKKIKKKFPKITVIELKKNVGTAAYDAAIKKSKSKYIYFSGCDIEAKQDMLDPLVDFLEKNEDVAQAAPKYLNLFDKKKIDLAGTWLSRSFYSGMFKSDRLGNKPIEIPYIGTGLIRRSIIDEFGYLFDNDYFFYGEDVDLGMRIRLLNKKIYYIPTSIVYHAGSISRKIHRPSHLTYLMERNLMRTFFSSLSAKNILVFLPYVLLMRLAAMLIDMLKLDFSNAWSRTKAIGWQLLNISTTLSKRKIVQKKRKVADSDVFRLFNEKYLFGLK